MLTNQKVKLGNSFSDAFSFHYILGPLLFTLYTTPSVISFPVSMSPTIYMPMTPKYILHLTIGTLILTCVQKWMDGVKLKPNPEKTEFIIIGDRQAREFLTE